MAVQIFGAFSLGEGGEGRTLTIPTKAVLANLILRGGKPVSRLQIAADVWPDADHAASLNRLRTALVHLRQALGQEFVQSRDDLVWTNFQDTDLARAERLIRRSRLLPEPTEELEVLQELIEIIGRDLLDGWNSEWIAPWRETWRTCRAEMSLRISDIASELELYDVAYQEASRALDAEPDNEGAWGALLRTSLAVEQERVVLPQFLKARQRRKAELGLDFSPPLLDLVRRINGGDYRRPLLSSVEAPGQRELFGQMLQSQIADNPELVLPLLGGQPFRRLAYQKPREAWQLLRTVVDATRGTEAPRVLAMLIAIKMADMVDEVSYAIDAAEWIIDNVPPDRKEHAYAVSLRGHMSFELREMEDAERFFARYLELTAQHGSEMDLTVAQLMTALIPLYTGRYEEAKSTYVSGLERLKGENSIQSLHNQASVMCHLASLYWYKGEEREAAKWAAEAWSFANINRFDHVRSEAAYLQGLSLLLSGDSGEGKRLLSMSFSQSYRSHYKRINLAAADFVAAGLVADGKPSLGHALLQAYGRVRAKASHERLPAEQEFVSRYVPDSASTHDETLGSMERPAQIIAYVADHLES